MRELPISSSTAWENLLALVAVGGAPALAVPDAGWDGLLSLARLHGIVPLVYRRCCLDNSRPLPPAVEAVLRQAYLHSAIVNARAYHQLATLLRAANESVIPMIVLKGACLAEAVYGNIALRSMRDLDLLFRWEDLTRLDDLCRSLGYTRPDGDLVELAKPDSRHHFPAFRRTDGLPLELHWTIAHQDRHGVGIGKAELEGLWSRSLPVTIAGVETRMLALCDLLLHECLHLANNHVFSWRGLRGLVDITAILDKYGAQLDWGVIERRAQVWGSWRGVSLALWLAHDWLGAAIPDTVAARLRAEPPPHDVVRRAREKMCQPAWSPLNDLPPAPRRWRLSEMPARLSRSLFPPRQTLARLYGRPAPASGGWLIYLYYPRRILDVARRYGTWAYRQVGGDREGHLAAKREVALRCWLREESDERS